MARNIEGKIQNLKTSIEKYIKDKLVVIEDLKINFEGVPFSPNDYSEWIQENITIDDREFIRGADTGGVNANENEVFVTFYIYVAKEKTKKANRHYEIRDIVADYFSVGDTISLYDFSGNNFSTVIQTLKIREVIRDTSLLDERKFFIYVYEVNLDWLEKF